MSNSTDAASTIAGSFLTLLSIANPIGSVSIFDQASSRLPSRDQRKAAHRVALSGALVLIAAILAGRVLLDAFGITLSALRIAGGLILGWHSWWLVVDEPNSASLKLGEPTSKMLIPLTFPITIGPGTLAAVIALGSPRSLSWEAVSHTLLVIVAVLLLAATIGVVYGHARRITSHLGQAGASAVTRASGFVLLCVATQMLLHGLRDGLTGT